MNTSVNLTEFTKGYKKSAPQMGCGFLSLDNQYYSPSFLRISLGIAFLLIV